MHIVQALVSLNVGGSELVAVELSEYLTGNGHRVTVIAADGPLSDRVAASGARHLNWRIGKKRLATLKYIKQLAEWIGQEQPDMIHVHSRLPAWICHRALKRLKPEQRPALVSSVHGQYTVSPYSAIMARGDRVIAVSEHIRQFTLENYRFVDPEKLTTVYGGTDPALFPYGYQAPEAWRSEMVQTFPQLAGKRLLLLPARLSRYKGHAMFLDLLAALKDRFSDVHGVILGEARQGSRYLAELEGLAVRNGVLDRITFTGLRTDVREWMAASAVVYNLCSDPPEAFGRTIPEALHLGVPVIGWDHGGVRETLATMFPQGAVRPDNLAELIERTTRFLEQPPAVPQSQSFLLQESMRRTLDIYQSLM